MAENSIRILHIITKLAVGGAQFNTLISTREISRMGYQSDILTGPEIPSEGDLFSLGEKWGLNIIIAPHLKRRIAPLSDVLALFEIKNVIKQGNYDIIHTHGSKARFLGRIAGASFPGKKIVQTAHGWPFYDSMNPVKKKIYTTLEKIGFKLAHINICVSPRDRIKAVSCGIGHFDDHRIIRSGVEFSDFIAARGRRDEARERIGIDPDAPVVGSVMRFCPEKAPDIFVQVACKVIERKPDTVFILVGDGPMRDETHRMIETSGISDNFVLLGSRKDVVEILPAFDVFLITSRTEGLPRVLLESLATGIPAVSTDVGGIHELVGHGRNGIICEESDVDALAEGVLTLLGSPELRRELVSGVDESIEPFSAAKMVSDLHTLYTKLSSPPLNVVLLCDNEPFNIPRTVARIIRKMPFNKYTIVSFQGHGSLRKPFKNLKRYLALYGPLGFVVQLSRFIAVKLSGFLRIPTRYAHSLRQAAMRVRAGYASLGDINSEKSIEFLESLEPDLFISIACPYILRKKALSLPRLGCWNVHSAMLPKNRGMLPTFWSLYKGDVPGVTFHRMVRKLDAGEILLQRSIECSIDDTSLHQLLFRSKELSAEIVAEAIERFETGDLELKPNPLARATSNRFPSRAEVRSFINMGGKITGIRDARPDIAISFDVEEWFQTCAARRWYPDNTWDNMQKRVNHVLDTILQILGEHRSKATFFFLGWIAEHHPELMEKVAEQGHEIGYHGYNHTELTSLTPDEFKRNLDKFEKLIGSTSVPMPVGFRAPSFSMKKDTIWAIDEIVSRGFKYDSSIYPMFKIRYGIPEAPRRPFRLMGTEDSILELPLASLLLAGVKVPVAGGAYLRFYPGLLHRCMLRHVSESGITPVLYFHPWEIDSLNISSSMSFLQRVRQHHNSGSNTVGKMRRILKRYRGITLSQLAVKTNTSSLSDFSL